MTDELNNTATASGLSAAAGYAVEWQDAAMNNAVNNLRRLADQIDRAISSENVER